MIQVEPIQNFDGFGTGKSPSEYYYSQGMCRTQFGLTPNWVCTKQTDSTSVSGLALINWFTASANNVFGADANGIIYATPIASNSWASAYIPSSTSNGNGLIVDQTNRVLIATNRYLSKWDGSTANITTGAVILTNTSTAVVGSGTSFSGAMVGKQIMFAQQLGTLYTVSAVADATHLTLNTGYTGSSTSSNYTIYMGSTEQWKDFGSSFSTAGIRQMEIYEDWVVAANLNNIAILNVTDDSFNNQGLTLPNGYNVATLRAGRNGILVGVNTNSRGAVFLWDAVSNGSISEWIWFNANVLAVLPTTGHGSYGSGYFVITSRGIYETDGYILTPLYEQMPDDRVNASGLLKGVQPNGVQLVGKYLVFFGGGGYNRQRAGVYMFNTETQLFEFAPVSTGVQVNLTTGAIFYDNAFNIYLSHHSGSSSTIDTLNNSIPSSAYLITEPKGVMIAKGTAPANEKNAEAAKFSIAQTTRQVVSTANLVYTLALKVYNFKRPLWSVVQTNTSLGSGNQIQIDGTAYVGLGQIGDEITVLQGANAGLVAHISNITNGGTNTETWTLDTTFSNHTENSVFISVSPFKLVRTFTFSGANPIRDVFFDIASKYKGKRFLLKLLFTNIQSELDITEGQFIYNDQGVITS